MSLYNYAVKHWIFGKTSNTAIQFFRYFWVGGSSAIVDLAIFSICIYALELHWYVAAPLAYFVGTIWNYVLSIWWVFKSSNAYKEFIAVCFISAGGLLWTYVLLYLFVDVWLWSELLSKMLSQVLILTWNFGLRKLVVF